MITRNPPGIWIQNNPHGSLLAFAMTTTDWEPATTAGDIDDYRTGDIHNIRDEKVTTHLRALAAGAIESYGSYYNVEFQGVEGFSLLRYTEGQQYKSHVDYAHGNNRLASGLIYLNDNYQAGQLWFNLLNYRFAPKAGDFIIFPSNYLFRHAALPPVGGTRYVINMFFK